MAVARLLLAMAAAAGPPPTPVETVRETIHGVVIEDPYRWLEDQQSPKTRAWIEAQVRYTRSLLDPLPGREALKSRLEQLLRVDSQSAPIVRGNRYFSKRRLAAENRSSIVMREGPAGADRVLVRPEDVSKDETVSVDLRGVSEDGKLLAYAVREGGKDETGIRLLDLAGGRLLPDTLPPARYYGFDILHDNSGYYYARHDPAQGSRVYFHAMGRPAAEDREIFGAGYGPAEPMGCELSEDGRTLLISVSFGVPPKKVEVYLLDVPGTGPVRAVVKDIEAEFRPLLAGGRIYLWTNWKAPKWRILAADRSDPDPAKWREVVPESRWPIEQATAAGGRLFVAYLENVLTRIREFHPSGKPLGEVKLPAIGSASPPAGRWDRDEAFFSFTSFVEPATIYRYSVSKGAREVWHRPRIPVKTGELETHQVWYESRDKTRVPMFLVHRKGLALDGNRPVLLTGYGGFAVSMTPAFDEEAAIIAERDGVFAMPCLRGGGEFGEEWHRAGMFGNKQNVFDDFIAAAGWLIANRYTRPEKLAIAGGSNGGLLVGAAITQRPEMFGAALCAVPLLDMLRYHKFKVGVYWVSEYGSAEDPVQFEYLRRYSPYHNVRKGARYPAVMFLGGDSDTRVDPLHLRKMGALLQASSSSRKPILLHYDTKAGHSAGKPVSQIIEDATDSLSFLFWQLGMLATDGPADPSR